MQKLVCAALIAGMVSLGSGAAYAQRAGDMPTIAIANMKADIANPVIDLAVTQSVKNAPDMATFSTGVQTKALKARDAIKLNADKMAAVLVRIKALGIADKDIQTSALTLSREYDYAANGKARFKGYRVANLVSANLRDLSRLGDVLDALASSGATEFDGPYFPLDKNEIATGQARDKAWDVATQQARYHAKKAGFADVKVVRVAEVIGSSQNFGGYSDNAVYKSEVAAIAADAAETPIQAGEITTQVTLSISFEMIK